MHSDEGAANEGNLVNLVWHVYSSSIFDPHGQIYILGTGKTPAKLLRFGNLSGLLGSLLACMYYSSIRITRKPK